MSSKLNADGILLFEQPFARVPYENYRRVFRSSQKHVEREFGAVQTSASELAARSKGPEINYEEASQAIDAMIGRVETLKSKIHNLHEDHARITTDVMRTRFEHLNALEEMQTSTTPEFSRWADTRLDRWLVDWALRNGKENTARSIAKEKDIHYLVDIDLFSEIARIEKALNEHRCSEALSWCSDNKTHLRKAKNNLEFDLRLQEYIELCRKGSKPEAIAHSKKYLLPWQESHLSQIQQASCLLAFPPSTTCPPYKRLYDLSRWDTLVKSFRLSIYALNTLPCEPLLNLALYGGLSALKLTACYDHATKNVDCPVCDMGGGYESGLGQLAKEVPRSNHMNSTIVCGITGKIMDQDNMPLVFPNGYVYSKQALEDMAARNGGKVTCPRSKMTCEYRELRTVFIS